MLIGAHSDKISQYQEKIPLPEAVSSGIGFPGESRENDPDDSIMLSTKAKEFTGSSLGSSVPPSDAPTPPMNATSIIDTIGHLLKTPIIDVDKIMKEGLLIKMISDQTGNDENKQKLVSLLAQYPREMIQKVADSGAKIFILKENTTPGTQEDKQDAPTDLGFGDKDGNGYVDLTKGEGKTSDGRDWNNVAGGYDSEENVLYVKEKSLNGSDYGNFVGLHEFAHAVDDCCGEKDPEWEKKIQGLYDDAMKNGQFVDKYAASNKKEFFAQDMASYFFKSEEAPDPNTDKFTTGNINRDNLMKKDPDMYKFISGEIMGSVLDAVW